MRGRLHFACCLAALAAGCAPLQPEAVGTALVSETAPDRTETLLITAAQRAEAALTALARVQAGERPQTPAPIPRDAPPELLHTATLDWIGPVETLAEALAKRAGYRFAVAGPRPVRPLIDLLRDAGIQLSATGTLTVDAERRAVRLDWAASEDGT